MPFGPSHRILRKVAKWAMQGFFSEILVIDEDNVPKDGPLIVCCTHWNMIVSLLYHLQHLAHADGLDIAIHAYRDLRLGHSTCLKKQVDPAILSCFFPHDRMLHYWAKSTIFINKPVSALLKDAGNIPVDRKNKDNQALFSGTFEVLKLGEAVAIFPEGTSYTEPAMQAIKEGASWAALEYAKNIRAENGTSKAAKDVKVVVASIVYTQKTNYRSRAVMQFGEPLPMQEYIETFLNDPEGPKPAVKKLTADIKGRMVDLTVNAPDWDTLRAAETARQLLWGDDDRVPLQHFRAVTQSLVDLLSPKSSAAAQATTARSTLIEYEALLRKLGFANSSLNALPLPRILDPAMPAAPPDRFSSLFALLRTTLSSLVFLPFFVLPLLAHLPIYIVGKFTQYYLSPDEAEGFAQNKIVFSLLLLVVFIYPTVFFFAWALFAFSTLGLAVAFVWTALFAMLHNRMVDRNYKRWKRLGTAWRVLLGIWTPHLTGGGQEAPVRKMLRLRSEAAKATADLLLSLENDASSGFDKENVSWYRSLGAKLGSAGKESDHKGRLS